MLSRSPNFDFGANSVAVERMNAVSPPCNTVDYTGWNLSIYYTEYLT